MPSSNTTATTSKHRNKSKVRALLDRWRFRLILLFKQINLRIDTIVALLETSFREREKVTVMASYGNIEIISDRKQMQEDLQKQYNLLTAAIEETSEAIYIKNLEGKYVLVNSTTACIIGKPVPEIIGKDDAEFFSQEIAYKLMETDRRIITTGQTEIIEETAVTNGTLRTYLSNKHVWRDVQGNIIGIVGISQDITDRKLAQEALRQKEERYAMAVKAGNVGVWDWNLETNEIYVDPSLKAMLGYEDWQIRNHIDDWSQLVVEEDRPLVMEAVQAHLKGLTPEYKIEHRMRHKDGSYRWFLACGMAIRDANGTCLRMMGTDTDITDKKQAEEALQKSERRFRSLIENSTDIIIIMDIYGVINYVSPSQEWILGYAATELVGKACFEFIHPEDGALVWEAFTKAMENPGISHKIINYRVRHRNGSWRIFEASLANLLGNSDVKGLVGNCRDITDRKQAEEALRESEERYRTLFQCNPHSMWVYDLETLAFLDVNDAAVHHYGYSREEFLAMTIRDIRPREDIPALLEKISQSSSVIDVAGTWRHCKKDGTIIYVEITAHTLTFAGRRAEVVLANDITDRKQAEEALRESERRYHNLARVSPVGIFRTDVTGSCLYVNERWCQMSGLTLEESLGEGWVKAIHPEDRERVFLLWYQATKDYWPFQSEYRLLRADGKITWVFGQATPEIGSEGEVVGYVGTFTDISKRKQTEELLRYYAFYDPLTALPNRTLFLERTKQTIANVKQGEIDSFAVLLLDLDRFQVVKSSLGHLVADRLLVATAGRLSSCLGPQDMAARVGLDEFAILLVNIDEISCVTRIADRIYQALSLPFNLNGQEVFVNASIGIAMSSIGYERAEEFLRAADMAMHQAQKQGKAGHAVFEFGWQDKAVQRLQMEADLRRAIERRELRVFYQPIVSLKTGKITGFEALVRWQHPTRGFISPGDFIPLAEETGLIGQIDRWVMLEACRQLAIWQQQFPDKIALTMSVNLSGLELAQIGLIERVDRILQESGIERKSLKLEITESSLLGNHSSEKAMLEQLKALDIQLLIDDFGTGYSSLARLHQMPIDTLKIDRSFVSQMTVDSESLEIVRTIISLAHILNMDVIAEGVETAEQLEQLRALECEYGQGYFFSRPIDSQATTELLGKDSIF